jgi:tRNA threonylcarbamoyladenosine biosynthesis protein TsaE
VEGQPKICLVGPFGAGKTTFVRGFVEGRGISSHDVQSPTFTLIRQYGTDKKIFHVDLYRLDNEDEIFEAGIFDLITSDELVLIEWADRLIKYRPEPSILIEFTHGKGTERSIEVLEAPGFSTESQNSRKAQD